MNIPENDPRLEAARREIERGREKRLRPAEKADGPPVSEQIGNAIMFVLKTVIMTVALIVFLKTSGCQAMFQP